MLAQQAEQKVFRAYIIVIQVPGFLDGVFDDFLGPGGLGQLAHGDHVRAALDQFFDFQADLAQIHVEVLQHVGADAAAFLDQAEQDVLRADVFVVEALGFLVGQGHDLARPIRKSFEHVHLLLGRQGWVPTPHRKIRHSCAAASHPNTAAAGRPSIVGG